MRGKEEGCLSFWSRFAVPLAVEGMVGNCCGGGGGGVECIYRLHIGMYATICGYTRA